MKETHYILELILDKARACFNVRRFVEDVCVLWMQMCLDMLRTIKATREP